MQCIWKQHASYIHNQYNLLHNMRIYYRGTYYSLLKVHFLNLLLYQLTDVITFRWTGTDFSVCKKQGYKLVEVAPVWGNLLYWSTTVSDCVLYWCRLQSFVSAALSHRCREQLLPVELNELQKHSWTPAAWQHCSRYKCQSFICISFPHSKSRFNFLKPLPRHDHLFSLYSKY